MTRAWCDASEPGAARPSARVATVCGMLDCDPSQVYRLVGAGELEAHGLGTRGVRVYLDSVAAYQQRSRVEPKNGRRRNRVAAPPKPSAAGRAAHNAAVAELRAAGLL